MQQKDHYSILKIKPNATGHEIKKAYHKLALLYHPDKNAGNAFAEAAFKEINEAYTLLSDAAKRKIYNQSFFQNHSYHYAEPVTEITPQDILINAENLAAYLNKTNIFLLDRDVLYFQLQQIVSQQHILILKEKADVIIIKEFAEKIMDCCKFLPLSFSNKITQSLSQLALHHPHLMQQIQHFERRQKIVSLWEKNKFMLALVFALVVCMLIWFIFK